MTKKIHTGYRKIQGDDKEDQDVTINISGNISENDWGPIQDLDEFFNKVYEYHQAQGFSSYLMSLISPILLTIIFASIIIFSIIAVRWSLIFGGAKENPNDSIIVQYEELKLSFWNLLVMIALITVILYRTLTAVPAYFYCKRIEKFFRHGLKIPDDDITNYTWKEVVKRLIEAQKQFGMAVYTEELTELDIYHRLLRHRNYYIALINGKKIDLSLTVPFYGTITYLTRGLEFNLWMILFKSKGAPFVNSYQLHEDYKHKDKLDSLKENLKRRFMLFGLLNLFLSPIIFLIQLVDVLFRCSSEFSPGCAQKNIYGWSFYSRTYLRHFNELDHELKKRLSLAYEPSLNYIDDFVSKLNITMYKTLCAVCIPICVILFCISMIDDDIPDVFIVPFLPFIVAIYKFAASLIPHENHVFNPEKHLTDVLNKIHYSSEDWVKYAHKRRVYKKFSKLFEMKYKGILEELSSPFVTPFLLIFKYPSFASPIVEFFHRETCKVDKFGDVCQYALMSPRDNRQHESIECVVSLNDKQNVERAETSLINFTKTNPSWKPPEISERFISRIHEQSTVLSQASSDLNAAQNNHVTFSADFDEGDESAFEALRSIQKDSQEFVPVQHSSVDMGLPLPRYGRCQMENEADAAELNF